MKIISDFERLRAFTLRLISKVDAKAAERIPEGFQNNLHCQLGHLLYVQDQCFFLWSGHTSCLGKDSPYFGEYFGIGTSPKNFDSLVPDWNELLILAKRHSQGLQGIIGSRLAEPLRKTYQFMNMKMSITGDTLTFLLAHEGEHIGHIKRLVKAVVN